MPVADLTGRDAGIEQVRTASEMAVGKVVDAAKFVVADQSAGDIRQRLQVVVPVAATAAVDATSPMAGSSSDVDAAACMAAI